jgi:hypothetical protein
MYRVDQGRLEVIVPKDVKQGFVNNIKDCYQFNFAQVFDQDST